MRTSTDIATLLCCDRNCFCTSRGKNTFTNSCQIRNDPSKRNKQIC